MTFVSDCQSHKVLPPNKVILQPFSGLGEPGASAIKT